VLTTHWSVVLAWMAAPVLSNALLGGKILTQFSISSVPSRRTAGYGIRPCSAKSDDSVGGGDVSGGETGIGGTIDDTAVRCTTIPNLAAVKARQKATWESGDFGQVARTIESVAEEFMARQSIPAGAQVLDVACGTGNLAVIAARRGSAVSGIDIAANLIEQARTRAAAEGLSIAYTEGDAETLPYADNQFDLVVTRFGGQARRGGREARRALTAKSF
jgi:Methyltransferase domain